MTIKHARKILGKEAESVPDEALQEEIDTVALLKNLFFEVLYKMKPEARKNYIKNGNRLKTNKNRHSI